MALKYTYKKYGWDFSAKAIKDALKVYRKSKTAKYTKTIAKIREYIESGKLTQEESKSIYAHIKALAEQEDKAKAKPTTKAKAKPKAKAKSPSKKASSPASSTQYKFTKLKEKRQASAKKSATGKVMGEKDTFYVVVREGGNKKELLGAFINLSSAKSSASSHLAGIFKAYTPFIPSGMGRIARDIDRTPRTNKTKRLRAKYFIRASKAKNYLLDVMGKKPFSINVYMVKVDGDNAIDKKYKNVVGKYNSPTIGSLRWNPKKRKSRK